MGKLKLFVDFCTIYQRNYETIEMNSGNVFKIPFTHGINQSNKFRSPSKSPHTTMIDVPMSFQRNDGVLRRDHSNSSYVLLT